MIAHNGGRFDTYVILKNLKNADWKFTNMIWANGRILSMTLKTKNCKFVFKDSLAFFDGSLKRACYSFKVP